MTNTKFLNVNVVESVLNNYKGQFLGITVEKKDGSKRVFNFKPAKENAPSFKHNNDLVSIIETGNGYRSFNKTKVLEIKFDRQVFKVAN